MTAGLHRLGKRLDWVVALVCVAVIAGIWLATLQRISFERRQAVDAVVSSNSNIAIAFEQQVYRTLKAAEQVAAFVREQYLIQGADLDLRQWVADGIIREKIFTIISVVNEVGDVVDSSHTSARVNYADRQFFLAQRDGHTDELYVSKPLIGRISGAARVPMSLRITQPDGSFGGVVVLSVDPVIFTDFYSQADLGERGLLELTGLDGGVRGRSIGRESGYGQDASQLSWMHRRLDARQGSYLDNGAGLDNVARLISYRSLQDYPMMVVVGASYMDELAPAMQRRHYYLAAASVASLALMLFAGLLVLLLDRRRKAAEALRASENLYRATFDQAAMGIAHVGPDGRILRANPKFHDMLAYQDGELAGSKLVELSDREYRPAVEKFLAASMLDGDGRAPAPIERPYRRKDASLVWVQEALGAVRRADGSLSYLVAVSQDITSRKQLEDRLSHAALHDVLTGLPNRSLFQDRLNHAMASAQRNGRLTAVLYMDLDGFKDINDTHGHAVGDLLLQQVARRLEASLRTEDTAARVGGDEFEIVLFTIQTGQDCQQVAAKLELSLSQPYEINGLSLSISASVGAAVYPTHGDDVHTLTLHADAAMYEVKRARKQAAQAKADLS